MQERLGRHDYRFLAVCFVLFSATVWYSVRNFHRAFPEASIDFRVSRAEGEALASTFLQADTAAYRRASSFTFDDDAKTFLEREAGLEQANRLMGTRLRLWRWSYRWFRPLQKEEYRVDVTPQGEIVGFQHVLPEDAPRPTPSAAEARALAENFLRTRMNRDPASLDFVTMAETTWPHRIDRAFTWQERDFDLHDARYRIEVNVVGNEPSGYREYLKIPEQWTRDYQRLRSKNDTAARIDLALMAGLVVGLIVVLVMRVRGHDILWRRAATVGMIGMALSFLSQLNQLPLAEFNYPTTDSYSSFMLRELLNAALGSLAAGGFLFVLTAGAEPLYREMFPRQLSVGSLFTLRGLRTKRFFLGAVLGLTLTGVAVAYQTGFYLAAYKFGAWSPADVPYDDLLNTRFPWAFVLFGGFFPAVSEEFLFRMFAIPFLRKLCRSVVIAIVVAGFIWGFGHANYPQQPFYIRGLEVGFDGVVVGFLMLKFGILPALIEHYSIDAMYTAMLLLRSHNLYFRLSGAASAGIILIPIAAALIAYRRNGGFAPETGLLNADEQAGIAPPPAPAREAPAALDYKRLPARAAVAALVLLVLGVAAAFLPVDRFGDAPKYKLTAKQAEASADAFLRSQSLDPAAFQRVAVPAAHWEGGDDIAGKYFLEHLPLRDASAEFERYRPIQHWRIRYFKPLDQEEALVTIQPESGKVIGYNHTLPEDRPGADLEEPAARAIASAFLWDVSGMDLKENASEKKKARRDYSFVWEARPGDPRNVAGARYRIAIGVAGDRPSSARVFWKLPEDYTRERDRQNAVHIAAFLGRRAGFILPIVAAILTLVRFVRDGVVPWRFCLILGGVAALLGALDNALGMHLRLADYPTAIPLDTFRMSLALGLLIGAVFAFVLATGAAALITSAFPETRRSLTAAGRRILSRDAAVALAAGAGLFLLLRTLSALAIDRFHSAAVLSIAAPTAIAHKAQVVSAAAGESHTLLTTAGVLATIVLLLRRGRAWWSILFLLPFITLPGGVHTPAEFALRYTLGLASVLSAAAFCRWFARRNLLAYAVAFWVLAFTGDLGEFYGNEPAAHFWLLLAVMLAGVLWALLPLRRESNA